MHHFATASGFRAALARTTIQLTCVFLDFLFTIFRLHFFACNFVAQIVHFGWGVTSRNDHSNCRCVRVAVLLILILHFADLCAVNIGAVVGTFL